MLKSCFPVSFESPQCARLRPRSILPQRIERGKVNRRSTSRPERTRQRTAPELAYWVGSACDGFYGCGEGVCVGLLDAGFEEVGGLEEDG